MNVGIFNGVTGGAARFEPYFSRYANELELVDFPYAPTVPNLELLAKANCEALIYFNSEQESGQWYQKLSETGIKYLCTPSKGYDHFNLTAMRKYGIKGANVPNYSPNAISEHTIMLLLAVLRKFRRQIINIENLDFGKSGLIGREICDLRVGIVGTGKIGAATIKGLSGFEPARIYANSHHQNPAIEKMAQYVELDELYQKSDVIIFHCSYRDSNYHMVNSETINRMKDGVILINTARGALFDTGAVADAVKCGKIGGLGLDVIEGEEALQDGEVDRTEFPLPILRELQSGYNVVFTNHTAFFTENAFGEVTKTTVSNLLSYERTGDCENDVTEIIK